VLAGDAACIERTSNVTTPSKSDSGDLSRSAEIFNSATVPGTTITAPAGAELPTKVRVRGKLLKLMISMAVANIGIFMIWGAVPGILLPLQVEGVVGNADKAGSLAIVATIGAFAAMIAQPLAGMVSDRTRSRFGRRAPWMVGGSLIGGLTLIAMGSANTIIELAIAWVIVQVTFNFAQGPLSAILPDRVPRSARGTFATFAGIGLMVGALGGSIVGAQFAKNIPAGYLFFAGFALVVVVLFVVFNPDSSNKGEPRTPFSFVTFLRTFWVSPIAHPDFFWGFTGRLLLYGGYFMVTGYQLYILQDYIGLGSKAVLMVPLLSVVSLVGTIIATVVSGPLSDKLGRRKIVVIVAGIILAISFVFPLFMPTITGMFLFSFVSGLGFGAYQGVDTALMSEVLPSKNDYGKDLGVLNIAATLPQTLAPGIAGLIIVVSGGYTALFPIGILVAVLGSLAVIPIKSVR